MGWHNVVRCDIDFSPRKVYLTDDIEKSFDKDKHRIFHLEDCYGKKMYFTHNISDARSYTEEDAELVVVICNNSNLQGAKNFKKVSYWTEIEPFEYSFVRRKKEDG